MFLLVVLCGSAVVGMPLHSRGRGCNMPGMEEGMDCCAEAQAQQDTPEVAAARLCCAFNCQTPGTTPTASELSLSPPAVVAQHPATFQTPFAILNSILRYNSAREHPQHSPPAYIRHLTLLI